jgi:NAD(P)H-hydrate epimerase
MQRLVNQNTLMGIEFIDDLPSDLSNRFKLIVDGFFGFSFKSPVREPFDNILSKIVQSKVPVASIDIPSGMYFYDCI